MNNISERSNRIINTKAPVLIANSEVNKNLWPEIIKILVDLSNQTEISIHKNMSFEIFLHIYNGDDNNSFQDLIHLKIFRYKARVHIS